jgi:predicted DNA-binding transcriptional regulator AlpA
MNPNEVMLTAKQVRTRYGNVSDMALWRWLRDARLAFPKPIVINNRRYWKLSELAQWELAQAGRKVA